MTRGVAQMPQANMTPALGRKYSHFVLASGARATYIGSEILTARRGKDVE
jgi:hypothetical protein